MSTAKIEPAVSFHDLSVLPPGWEWTTVGELATHVTSGSRGWAKYYTESGKLFVRVGNLNRCGISIDTEDAVFVNAPNNAEAQRAKLQKGDILISITADVGMVGIVENKELQWSEAFINQHICLVRLKSGVSFRFAGYMLMTEPVQQKIRQKQYGLTKTGLGLEDVKALSIPFPPLAEQQRIVEAIETELTRLDAGVASLRAARAKLRRYRAAVLKAACEGRLVAQDPSDEPASALLQRILAERRERWLNDRSAVGARPCGRLQRNAARYEEPAAPDVAGLPELPTGWTWTIFKDILHELKNGFFAGAPAAEPPGLPILRINAVRPLSVIFDAPRYLPQEQLEKARPYLLEDGDLLFTRYNGSLGLVGVCGMVRHMSEHMLYPDKLIRARVIAESALPAYIELYFATNIPRRWIEQKAKTTAGQQGIAGGELKGIPVALPPLAEQRRIVAEVERRLSVIAALEAAVAANLKRAERLRQAILKRAFAGKLVPQDPSDESASVLLERIRVARQEGAAVASDERRGRPRKAEDGAQKSPSDAPKRRGRPRKDAAQPTGRALPASEPVHGAEQLTMEMED